MSESTPQPSAPAVPEGIELARGVRIAPSALRLQYARSRGPGGQNVNKVNTKTDLWVPVSAIGGLSERAAERLRQIAGKRLTAAGEIHIAADSERTQEQNREQAMSRLRAMIAAAVHEPKVRRKTKPSRAAKKRRVESKRIRGQIKAGRRGGGREE